MSPAITWTTLLIGEIDGSTGGGCRPHRVGGEPPGQATPGIGFPPGHADT